MCDVSDIEKATRFELLSLDETVKIMSVLNQSIKDRPPITQAHKIIVAFPEIANKLWKTDTPANGFCVLQKSSIITSPHQREFIEILWDRGLVTIEIIRNNGICAFYALPKAEVMKRDVSKVFILPVGEDPNDESISVADFYI
jgi:hypothetical protein